MFIYYLFEKMQTTKNKTNKTKCKQQKINQKKLDANSKKYFFNKKVQNKP
jgi:hypothetical protein